jgi:ribosome-associated protein
VHPESQAGGPPAEPVEVAGPLALGSFVKLSGVAGTGGQAKLLIQDGAVRVNGVLETRRGRVIVPGDAVEIEGRSFVVVTE